MVSEQIANFLNFARDACQKYSMACQDEEQANFETQDILHSLELYTHPYHQKAKLAGKLVEVRQRRRTAKNAMGVYGPIVKWAEENKAVIKSLERLLGEIRKEENIQKNRCYVNRTSILEEL